MTILRCPTCGGWDVKLGDLGGWRCAKCGKVDLRKIAAMDGIFLDKNKNLIERSANYLNEGCLKLGFQESVKNCASLMIQKYITASKRTDCWGKRSLVAAAVYIAAFWHGQRRTQPEIGDAFNVTNITLSKHYRDIFEKLVPFSPGINRDCPICGNQTSYEPHTPRNQIIIQPQLRCSGCYYWLKGICCKHIKKSDGRRNVCPDAKIRKS